MEKRSHKASLFLCRVHLGEISHIVERTADGKQIINTL